MLGKYSAKHKFKLINDFTHLYGSFYRIRLALEEGKVQFDNVDWEDILQCEDKISISNRLIKNLACKVTAVMSYHESVQMAAHLDHILYPDLPIQKFVNAAFEQIYHVRPTITIIA